METHLALCFSALPPWHLSKCAECGWSRCFNSTIFVHAQLLHWKIIFPVLWVNKCESHFRVEMTVTHSVITGAQQTDTHQFTCDAFTAKPQSTEQQGVNSSLSDESYALFWSWEKKTLLCVMPRQRSHRSSISTSNSEHPLLCLTLPQITGLIDSENSYPPGTLQNVYSRCCLI